MSGLLLLSGLAHALWWWAPDAMTADQVREALVEGWPAGPFVVRIGAPDGSGAWYEAGILHVETPTARFAGPVGPDPLEQVVVARTWLRESQGTKRTTTAAVRPHLGLLGGTGVGDVPAPIHLSLEAGGLWRQVAFSTVIEGDLAAIRRAEDDRPVHEQRVGLVGQVGLQVPLWGGELRVEAGPAARLVTSRVPDTLGVSTLMWGGSERIHWWRTAGPGWIFGVGWNARVDSPGSSLGTERVMIGGTAYEPPELGTSIEVGFAWIGGQ